MDPNVMIDYAALGLYNQWLSLRGNKAARSRFQAAIEALAEDAPGLADINGRWIAGSDRQVCRRVVRLMRGQLRSRPDIAPADIWGAGVGREVSLRLHVRPMQPADCPLDSSASITDQGRVAA